MTSDGITNRDWALVKRMACKLSNETARNDCESAARAKRSLLAILSRLEAKYGPKPSILATRADYLPRSGKKTALLLRAYRLAERSHDGINVELICLSLAKLYLEDLCCIKEGKRWLARYERALSKNKESGERRTLGELRDRLLQLCRAGNTATTTRTN